MKAVTPSVDSHHVPYQTAKILTGSQPMDWHRWVTEEPAIFEALGLPDERDQRSIGLQACQDESPGGSATLRAR